MSVRQRLSSGTTPAFVGDNGVRKSNRTLHECSLHAMRAVKYRRLSAWSRAGSTRRPMLRSSITGAPSLM